MGPKFDDKTKRTLADRVNSLCSHPDCRAQTKGPRGVDTDKAVNVGEAAHITAANRGAARYDATLTDEQRRDASNGIWMCGVHAKLIDNDAEKFPVELLREWKKNAEEAAFQHLGRTQPVANHTPRVEADRNMFRKFMATVPSSGSIGFLRTFNFAGGSFSRDALGELADYHNAWVGPDHEFLDEDLESLRKDFSTETLQILAIIATNTWSDESGRRSSVPAELVRVARRKLVV